MDDITYHYLHCPIGIQRCADCSSFVSEYIKSAIQLARLEVEKISDWLKKYPGVCVYCGEDSESKDHLVPKPLTGPIMRKFVPTVPACLNCNITINDVPLFTIKERAEHMAILLKKKYKKDLSILDHTEEWFQSFAPRMRENLKKRQLERYLLRRRLAFLEIGGATCSNLELESAERYLAAPRTFSVPRLVWHTGSDV